MSQTSLNAMSSITESSLSAKGLSHMRNALSLQSIYAFRGAAAADWQETYNLLGRNEQKVQLIKDYRSLPGVVFAADELRSLR